MKVGLYFGSFNPVHNGHLVIAGYMAEFTELDQVWLVVSPHNPLKNASTLLNDYQRVHLVELAIGDYRKLKVSKVEFGLPKPSYTVVTLAYLYDRHPEHEFSLIMGSDNLATLHKWKDYRLILDNHDIYVYPRPLSDGGEFRKHPRVRWVEAPLIELSSTFIRHAIRDGRDVRFMMPESVAAYVDEMNFYRK